LRITHIQRPEQAPTVALMCDGAFYDVLQLRRLWQPESPYRGDDFHTLVFSLRCLGFDSLYDRLWSGDRPTEARVHEQPLVLPPCDPDRAAYIQMAPYNTAAQTPLFAHRDARGLVGHDQLVPFPAAASSVSCEAGLAVLLKDHLYRASGTEAEEAVLGYSLLLDWSARPADSWSQGGHLGPDAPSQLGPAIITTSELDDIEQLSATLSVGGQPPRPAGRVGDWRFHAVESLAYLSQSVPLRAGDVIGIGCLPAGRIPVAGEALRYSQQVKVTLHGLRRPLTLAGEAVRGLEPPPWRLADPRG